MELKNMVNEKPLFASFASQPELTLPDEAHEAARRVPIPGNILKSFVSSVDDRMIDVYNRAQNPNDPFELRDLWLGRVEYELGSNSSRSWLLQKWKNATVHRRIDSEEILNSRATVRFIKELFNWFFRDDLYGDLHSDDHLILSSGSVDEEAWGLPETLKECIRYALNRDWYGYSDSRGRVPSLEAIAAYENERIENVTYGSKNVAITMGATFAISSLADFILLNNSQNSSPALCGIPNYPPLVESIARRSDVKLVPLSTHSGYMSLEPLIASLRSNTPLVMLQTAANPTGSVVSDADLDRLIQKASPSTIILLDECHEWLGPSSKFSPVRAARNVIRVSSVSKGWSAPGLKVGWILSDPGFIADYYEYASTTFGGPPSFFYTMIEVLARMERWLITGLEQPEMPELKEFESSYGLDIRRLQAAYYSYRRERIARETGLVTLRNAAIAGLTQASASTVIPSYSVNMAIEFPGWDDSYKCFRDLLQQTGIAVYPGILNFCLSGGVVRITPARKWEDLSNAINRLHSRFANVSTSTLV